MKHISEWEAKAWLAVLSGVVLGCVATVWMAVENEIDHYYRPPKVEIGPVEVTPDAGYPRYEPAPLPKGERLMDSFRDFDERGQPVRPRR